MQGQFHPKDGTALSKSSPGLLKAILVSKCLQLLMFSVFFRVRLPYCEMNVRAGVFSLLLLLLPEQPLLIAMPSAQAASTPEVIPCFLPAAAVPQPPGAAGAQPGHRVAPQPAHLQRLGGVQPWGQRQLRAGADLFERDKFSMLQLRVLQTAMCCGGWGVLCPPV